MEENRKRLSEIEQQMREFILGGSSHEEEIEFRKKIKELAGEKNVRYLLDMIYNAHPFTSEDNKAFAFFIFGHNMYNSLKSGEKLTNAGKRIIVESGSNPELYSKNELDLLMKLYENNKSLVDKFIEDNKKEFTKISFFEKVKEVLFPS